MKVRSMKYIYLIFGLVISTTFTINAQEIVSPNKNIKAIVSKKESDKNSFGQVYFKILYKNKSKYIEIIPNSPLGILRDDQQFTDNLKLISESKSKEVNQKYEMISGKRKWCDNLGTEKVFKCINSNNEPLNIVFRVYNDGVAFRYEFTNKSNSLVNVIDESTTYVFPSTTNRWLQTYTDSYEGFYPFSDTGKSNDNKNNKQEWGFPALFKINNNPIWVLISEANISGNNCASKLNNSKNPNQYKVRYASPRDTFKQTGVKTTLPWNSQWHTLIIGGLSDVVESTLITDVSEPNKVEEINWIKPGAVSWIYWAYNHGSKDYQKVVEYIDLAVEMKWPYVLIDWEWDVMSNGGNIIDVVNYAKSKGIKPMIWYNSGTSWLEPTPNDRLLTPEKRAKEFAWLNKMGIYGIKVDFFAGDQQDMMKYCIAILKDAAKYKIMVNFHGATVPRGWARTYPNLMTTEAVYGAEWYNNNTVLTDKAAAHNTTLPFTRNVVGSMDYTPVTFTNSQHLHSTSYAHELALSVVFESGFQHFADRPEGYKSLPSEPKEFLKNVPVSWDETKLLDGYPGEKVIIARKKGNQWYLGGLNGNEEIQTLKINFDFLGTGNFKLKLIKDGENDKSFAVEVIKVKKGDLLNVECLPRGGFVAVVEK
ncbi:glycoside hydrolase family 97 protein [Wenyingzhuangia marina]|uniref:Glycosyl-hydrolase 97 C-terminal, oligomerisation n=1 Tax=Wenyingzhuangia marina TaxID=1195760 RepID=A0A1M5UIG6_9FLAO|nr:glycoside hydrolase family 97 protein [Wenyingzhuangia marina]GGF67437.1 alpha-glucosidase [Wenyingzhuangia marina]SHH62824.1 Glycosyl-hydrolase 97 C-terminal, oligomerisation [Wenyingzhuangia marina]